MQVRRAKKRRKCIRTFERIEPLLLGTLMWNSLQMPLARCRRVVELLVTIIAVVFVRRHFSSTSSRLFRNQTAHTHVHRPSFLPVLRPGNPNVNSMLVGNCDGYLLSDIQNIMRSLIGKLNEARPFINDDGPNRTMSCIWNRHA